MREGLWKCGHCRKQFTVKVGTVFEHARIPLHKMLQAVYLISASKKGVSAHQIHRVLEISYKAAWFLAHRIREAPRDSGLHPIGGAGKVVEVAETFISNDRTIKPKGEKKGRGYAHNDKVLTLFERNGRTRSMVVNDLKADTLLPILREQIAAETVVYTDEVGQYRYLGRDFAHEFVRHGAGERGAATFIRTPSKATSASSSEA